MLKNSLEETACIALPDLGALRIKGGDGVRFLQGQLSNDVELLSSAHSVLAGYHNPQGRTIAVLHLVRTAPDEILAILPRELAAVVAPRLAKFILRAKVAIEDISHSVRIDGLVSEADAPPPPPGVASATLVRVANEPHRWLAIQAADAVNPTSGDRSLWRRLDIAAGLPHVYAETSEEFVAQMLNLDALGAIAFDKGCYTGQEVIARAHYRGRVKRRMQRFLTRASQEFAPGAAGRFSDGRAFKVVDAVRLDDGTCEFLAVAAMSARDEAPAEEAAPLIEASLLPLPYELPP
jgi:folate-binding protein YgfZ